MARKNPCGDPSEAWLCSLQCVHQVALPNRGSASFALGSRPGRGSPTRCPGVVLLLTPSVGPREAKG